MSLWNSYRTLQPKTRIYLGLALMANATLALQFSDQIESYLGLTPTKQDEETLKKSLPGISVVERDGVK